jgi:hypothetical protein
VVALGESLGIATVAEGIETPDQPVRMRSLECTYGLGYFFALPLLAAEMEKHLDSLASARVSVVPESGSSEPVSAPPGGPAPASSLSRLGSANAPFLQRSDRLRNSTLARLMGLCS